MDAEKELVKPVLDSAAVMISVMVPGIVFCDVKLNGAAEEPVADVPV